MKRLLLFFAVVFIASYSGSICAQISFANPSNYTVGTAVGFGTVKSGDFNNDGFKDIACVMAADNSIGILLNTGTGTFGPVQVITSASTSASFAVGDFNNDHLDDLAAGAGTAGAPELNIFLNNSANPGTFTKTTYPGVSPSADMEAIDYNKDGNMDLVIGGMADISLLQNDGQGVFSVAGTVLSGETPFDIVVKDLDGNGYDDIVLCNQYASQGNLNILKVFKNDGAGNFSLADSYNVGSASFSIAVNDINGDGKPDIAACVPNSTGNNALVYLFENNGSGGFTPTSNFISGTYAGAVILNDFDGDGYNDLTAGDIQGSSTAIFVNNGVSAGNFTLQNAISTPFPWSAISEDFNKDGKPDLAIMDASTASVSVYLNTTQWALPVDLKAFTGKLNNGIARLDWESGVETAFEGYEIEKSTDGTGYIKIGSVEAKGSNQTYQFTIPQTENIALYRLKLKSEDESHTYSHVVTVNNSSMPTAVILSPNPARNFIHVQIKVAGKLAIYDGAGKIIKTEQLQVGDNKIDIRNLNAGVYYGIIGNTKLSFIKY